MIAFFSTATLSGSVASCEQEGTPDDSKLLSIVETKNFLKASLEHYRSKMRKRGKLVPMITLSTEGREHSCNFPLPRNTDPIRVLAMATQQLQASGHSLEVHSAQATPGSVGSSSLSWVMKGDQGSLLLRWAPGGAGCSFHLYKEGGFTRQELLAVKLAYEAAYSSPDTSPSQFSRDNTSPGKREFFFFSPGGSDDDNIGFSPLQRRGGSSGGSGPGDVSDPLDKLRSLGVMVYDKDTCEQLDWDSLAGYENIKKDVEDTVIMALQHPEAYDNIARHTRRRYESNRPRAVLFEGPPGTGKTLTARIIANRSSKPMVHVNVESIMSKWYGESEKKLAQVFDTCDQLGGAIIFIDEIDALATSRDTGQMHEATRRVLSVILQRIEGFEGNSVNTLICATNRKADLDAALVNRYDLTLRFDLPDEKAREAILERYAQHLSKSEVQTFASAAVGCAGRDIKEVCEHAERRWASKVIRKEVKKQLPTFKEYMDCLGERLKGSSQAEIAEA